MQAEDRITRKRMLAVAAGGAGALALLAMGKAKEARAQEGVIDARITNKDVGWINAATEDTLALIKTNTTGLVKSTDVLNVAQSGLWNVGILGTVPVSGSLGRTWTITETVAISHANFDVAFSSLAKETGGNLATLTAKDFATQATLAARLAESTFTDRFGEVQASPTANTLLDRVKVIRDQLDVLLSSRLAEATFTARINTQGQKTMATSTPVVLASDHSNLPIANPPAFDVNMSTRLKLSDYVLTQELGRVGIILTASGVIIDPRQIRTLTSTDIVDISDKAARLLGVVYGSRGQQLLQTATNFNAQVELATGATLYDGRQIRTLTTTDSLEARPGNSTKTLAFASIDAALSGDNTIVAADVSNKIKVTDYTIVTDGAVAARWKSATTNLSGAMSFPANGGAAPAAGAGRWLFETAVNQALILNLSAAVGVRGNLTYFKEAS